VSITRWNGVGVYAVNANDFHHGARLKESTHVGTHMVQEAAGEGEALIDFQRYEVSSLPQHGGSVVRANTDQVFEVAELGRRLRIALSWNGVAQVEYMRSQTGDLFLMEINPKFWASYALASRTGHRIATTAVADTLGLSLTSVRTRKPRRGRMVFPLRELAHALRQDSLPGVLRAALAIAWPPQPRWTCALTTSRPSYRRGHGDHGAPARTTMLKAPTLSRDQGHARFVSEGMG
jgi:hypothetical protein